MFAWGELLPWISDKTNLQVASIVVGYQLILRRNYSDILTKPDHRRL